MNDSYVEVTDKEPKPTSVKTDFRWKRIKDVAKFFKEMRLTLYYSKESEDYDERFAIKTEDGRAWYFSSRQ